MRPGTTNPADTALEEMLRLQVIERGMTDAGVLRAMRSVPREKFFPPGTRDNVYADRAHPIGHGQTISQPYIVALMTHKLELEPEHRVLEIGTGTGYQTAILSHLAAEVFTIERIKPLLDSAFDRLCGLALRNIRFRHGDGLTGWPDKAPFDRILIAAAAPTLPVELLLHHLTPNGIAILPLGPSSASRPSRAPVAPNLGFDDHQVLTLVRKRDGKLEETPICPVRFVHLVPGV